MESNDQENEAYKPDQELVSSEERSQEGFMSEQSITDFLYKELDVRKSEIERDKHQSDNNRVIAEKSIEASLKDNEIKASHFNKKDSRRMQLAAFGIAVLVTFLIAAMAMEKTEFAHDIVKMLIGGVAGYFIGKNKKPD